MHVCLGTEKYGKKKEKAQGHQWCKLNWKLRSSDSGWQCWKCKRSPSLAPIDMWQSQRMHVYENILPSLSFSLSLSTSSSPLFYPCSITLSCSYSLCYLCLSQSLHALPFPSMSYVFSVPFSLYSYTFVSLFFYLIKVFHISTIYQSSISLSINYYLPTYSPSSCFLCYWNTLKFLLLNSEKQSRNL